MVCSMCPGKRALAQPVKSHIHDDGQQRDPRDVRNDHVHREIAAHKEDAIAKADSTIYGLRIPNFVLPRSGIGCR